MIDSLVRALKIVRPSSLRSELGLDAKTLRRAHPASSFERG